jgi:ribosome assembly protein SQT1
VVVDSGTTTNATTDTTTTTSATVPLSHPHADSVSCLSFNSPYVDGDVSGKRQRELLAAGSYDGSIALYDVDDARRGAASGAGTAAAAADPVLVLEGPSDVEFVSFHPRGGTVLLAGSVSDGTVWMYHAPTGRCMQVFVGHEGGATAGSFTPDGRWVVTAGQDGTCRVWAPKTGVGRHVFRLAEGGGSGGSNDRGGGGGGGGGGGEKEEEEGGGGLTCLAVGGGQDGQLAACGGTDGRAYVVHVSGKKLIAKLAHYEAPPPPTTAAAGGNGGADGDATNDMDDDDDAGGGGGGGGGEARSVEAVGFCPPDVVGTANWVATGGVDGTLKVWNTANAGVGGGGAQMRHRCVRPRDGGAAGGGGGGGVVVAAAAGITRLRWHDALPLVFCSYTDGAVCAWDARTGKLVETMTGHGDMINDMSVVSFVGGGGADGSLGGGATTTAVVVTGSDDRKVKVFEFRP